MTDTTDTKKGLSTTAKWGIGLAAAAAVGAGIYYWRKNKAEAETAKAEPLPAKPDVEPIYAIAPAVSLKLDSLPLMRAVTDTAPASSYWVYGDDTALAVASAIDKVLTPTTGNLQSFSPSGVDSTNLLMDLSVRLANHGTEGFPGGKGSDGIETPPSDLWLVVLGPKQVGGDPKLLKEYVVQLRKALGTQRVLWVLAKSTSPAIAKALNEASEEFVRSGWDDVQHIAVDAANAAAAPSPSDLAKAFPPPSA